MDYLAAKAGAIGTRSSAEERSGETPEMTEVATQKRAEVKKRKVEVAKKTADKILANIKTNTGDKKRAAAKKAADALLDADGFSQPEDNVQQNEMRAAAVLAADELGAEMDAGAVCRYEEPADPGIAVIIARYLDEQALSPTGALLDAVEQLYALILPAKIAGDLDEPLSKVDSAISDLRREGRLPEYGSTEHQKLRYNAIRKYDLAGWSEAAIASRLHLSADTVTKALRES